MGKGSLTFHIVDTDALQKLKEYEAAHPGSFWTPRGSVKDTSAFSRHSQGQCDSRLLPEGLVRPRRPEGYTVLHEEVGLNGNEIKEPRSARDPVTGEPTVNFVLTGAGGEPSTS